MIIRTEGFILDSNLSKGNNTLYLKLFTPSGRLYCYAGRINKKPSSFSPEVLKYSKVFVKVFFNDPSERGITRFPGEVVELKVIERYGTNETVRKFFRYARYFLESFSVLKSGERFYRVLDIFADFLRSKACRSNCNLDLKNIIRTFEVLIFREEGLLGKFGVCKHADTRKLLVFLADRGSFFCSDCFSEILEKESENLTGAGRYVDGVSAFRLCRVLSITGEELSTGLVERIAGELEKAGSEAHEVWDQFFVYQLLFHVHEKRGTKFLERRRKYFLQNNAEIVLSGLISLSRRESIFFRIMQNSFYQN